MKEVIWSRILVCPHFAEGACLPNREVVRFQHKHYVPIALFSGLVLPWAIAHLGWKDGLGGLVWGGAVARLLIW